MEINNDLALLLLDASQTTVEVIAETESKEKIAVDI